jgi:hypothetical protein
MLKLALSLTYFLLAFAAQAETADVKYRGVVELKPIDCSDTPRSSFIERVCYDKQNHT